MDLPENTHNLSKLQTGKKKSKKKHKSRTRTAFNHIQTFGHDVKNSIEQWWKPSSSNQVSPSSTQPDDEIQQKIAILNLEDSTSDKSEDNDILFHQKFQGSALKNDAMLLRKKLFLTEEDFPDLYRDINEKRIKFKMDMAAYNPLNGEEPKYVHEPTTQLSHDGLALLSHIYAQKDNLKKQPIVIKTFEGFKKIVNFIDDLPNDTSITLIMQFNEGIPPFLSKDIHRISMRLEKINAEIHAIYLDSVNDSQTLAIASLKLNQFIHENATKHNKEKTVLHVHLSQLEKNISRQTDHFQCSVFATKDARELNRSTNSKDLFKELGISNTGKEDSQHYYCPPAKYLKGLQSRSAQEVALAKFSDTVVARKGLTLKEIYAKHPNQSYIPHFSKKYETLVIQYANRLSEVELNTAINNYKAEEITPERLQLVYGNNN